MSLCSRLTLIQGPPGTGKTAVSVKIIMNWIQRFKLTRSGAKCFAGSDSNIAVDNILEGLVKNGVNVIRVGR
jgi:Ni2+-binding GTPase involved in maturation of urease and hydrogenase